jgi:hypothetical protein
MFELLWHRLGRPCEANVLESGGRICVEPLDMLCTPVRFSSVAKGVFSAELGTEAGEPTVVGERGADPLATGVVLVARLVATEARGFCERSGLANCLFRGLWIQCPMTCIEHLTGLYHHFYHVFVALPAGTATRVRV